MGVLTINGSAQWLTITCADKDSCEDRQRKFSLKPLSVLRKNIQITEHGKLEFYESENIAYM